MPVARPKARITGIIAVALFLVVLGLPEKGKDIRDRHHVLELFWPWLRQASEGKRTPRIERGPPIQRPQVAWNRTVGETNGAVIASK
jgi:hypothetical protein